MSIIYNKRETSDLSFIIENIIILMYPGIFVPTGTLPSLFQANKLQILVNKSFIRLF